MTRVSVIIPPTIAKITSGRPLIASWRKHTRIARSSLSTADLRTAPVRPYLAQASVMVIPLRAGSGTRIKVLEAMASGKAIVSTTLGAEGLDVAHGEHLLLADSAGAFARAAADLVRDPARRAALGREARRLVETRYSWDLQAAKLEQAVESLASGTKEAVRTLAYAPAEK